MTSSFQTQSVPLLGIVAQVIPDLPILFLDTGYHFPETLAFRDDLMRRWGLNVRILRPDAGSVGSQGPELFRRDPDLCCHLRKVEPLRRAMEGYDAMISGIRRDQTPNRAEAGVVEKRNGVLRIHPMLEWTEADIWEHIDNTDLPVHPLLEDGYTSVGCAPCTRPVQIGEDPRAGRWADTAKTECGLHFDEQPESGSGPKRSTG